MDSSKTHPVDNSAQGSGNDGPIPTFFLAGYQKTASTWLWWCFREHPDIFVPERDALHYFDIYFHNGLSWYRKFFEAGAGQPQIGDTTPSYMRFHKSRVRMAELNPNAKILVTVRNPIERAFSHYWHEKKKRNINYRFESCMGNNVDIYDHWLASGFYHSHLTHLLTLYPREQVEVLVYDDLESSPADFIKQVFRFLEVDDEFVPSVLNESVNKAWFRPTWGEMLTNLRRRRPLRESEYDRGIEPGFRDQLREVFRNEIDNLEQFLDRDLSHWT